MTTAQEQHDADVAVHDCDTKLPPIIELTNEEWWMEFDRNARDWLGMSGEEFIRKFKAGEIEDPDRSDVITLMLMMP